MKITYVTGIRSPPGLLVYPGQLVSVDRSTYAYQAPSEFDSQSLARIFSIDRLQSPQDGGTYTIDTVFSNASEEELRAAGTNYPQWVQPYRGFSSGSASYTSPSYRPSATMQRILDLALQATKGADNPYDQARAIESYLRSAFTYTLSPPAPPPGTDPLEFFLFSSRQGYCQYFAIAMGDLLRALGIPARVVNGFGPGTYDSAHDRYVVSSSDAHTWVEAYFPGYGWITFEPTPDGTYFPIARPTSQSSTGAQSANPAPLPPASESRVSSVSAVIGNDVATLGRGLSSKRSVPWLVAMLPLLLVALLASGLAAARPRTVNGTWRRLRWLAAVAGHPSPRSDTPLEFVTRLASAYPAHSSALLRLGEAFALAAYGPPELAPGSKPRAEAAWREVWPLLVRRGARRWIGGGRRLTSREATT